MFKYRMLFGLVAVLLMSMYAMGAYVIPAVENGSFEEPGNGKHNAWDEETNGKGSFTDVPDWESDTGAADSGVESDWPGSTDGVYSGFLMNGDPEVWNIVSYRVQSGDQFKLAVDARNNWSASPPAKLGINLYYIAAGGARTLLGASGPLDVTDSWATYYLDVADASAAVGKLLCIGIVNATDGSSSSWMGIDNVRFVPEPATMLLLGIGSVLAMRRRK